MEQISSHKRYLFWMPRPKNSQYLDKLHYPGKQIVSVSLQTKQNSLICSVFNRKKIKNTYRIERSIARENNKSGFHYEKWEPLLPLISP